MTAHRLAEAYDTGAILRQRTLAIEPSWNAWTLARKLDRPSLSLLREVVRDLADGAPVLEHPQDESKATFAPEPRDVELALSWHEPARAIVRRIRAASPWPGAFTSLGDALVTITRAEETGEVPRALEPGEAVVREDGAVVVRAADRGVLLHEARDEDERPLDAWALARLVGSLTSRR